MFQFVGMPNNLVYLALYDFVPNRKRCSQYLSYFFLMKSWPLPVYANSVLAMSVTSSVIWNNDFFTYYVIDRLNARSHLKTLHSETEHSIQFSALNRNRGFTQPSEDSSGVESGNRKEVCLHTGLVLG